MLQSQDEQTIFIDADNYAAEPFPELFALLDRFDCAANHEEYQNTDWLNNYPRPGIPESFPEFNTGILVYRQSPAMKQVLERWSELYRVYREQRDTSEHVLWCEPSFRKPEHYNIPVLSRTLAFSPGHDESFFQELPAAPAVFLLRGDGDPYVSKTADLRRRLQRLLGPPTAQSRRLNLRDRVHEIEFTPTGSDFESQFLLYQVLREAYPKTYAARLRLRPTPLVKLHLENEYPRASVTTRLGKLAAHDTSQAPCHSERRSIASEARDETQSRACPERLSAAKELNGNLLSQAADLNAGSKKPGNLYYGPFPSRAAAEKFASDALDFFKMRRCVEDLHPDPAFPGCVYSEMKMCLAPCFKGCTDAEYHAEVERVQNFFDTGGESLVRELGQQRERASIDLAFEEAAVIHTKIEKLKPLLSQLPEIVHRIDQLEALIIQPSAQIAASERAGTESSAVMNVEQERTQSVCLFLFADCSFSGPIEFSIQPRAESQSMESRLAEAIATFPAPKAHSTTERMEHLSILKRWYYRSNRIGEVFFANDKGEWPFRRIVRGIGRVYRGENPQEPAPFSATPNAPAPSV